MQVTVKKKEEVFRGDAVERYYALNAEYTENDKEDSLKASNNTLLKNLESVNEQEQQ